MSLSGMVMMVGLGGCLWSDVLLALEGRVRGRWVVVVLAVRGWLVVLVVRVLLVLMLLVRVWTCFQLVGDIGIGQGVLMIQYLVPD